MIRRSTPRSPSNDDSKRPTREDEVIVRIIGLHCHDERLSPF